MKAEEPIRRLFRKARCEGMWEQKNSSGYREEDRDCRILRILRRKTSQDVVTGHGRRKEKEESITTSQFQAHRKGCYSPKCRACYKVSVFDINFKVSLGH